MKRDFVYELAPACNCGNDGVQDPLAHRGPPLMCPYQIWCLRMAYESGRIAAELDGLG